MIKRVESKRYYVVGTMLGAWEQEEGGSSPSLKAHQAAGTDLFHVINSFSFHKNQYC